MQKFDPEVTSADFEEFGQILQNFFGHVPENGWNLKTGTREKDWTLHQLVAHLVSISHMFYEGAKAVLAGDDFVIEGLPNRTHLRDWNDAQITHYSQQSPDALCGDLLDTLGKAAQFGVSCTPEEINQAVPALFYNRPAHIRELIDWQLSHAGVIHASQITRPLELPPLWEGYSPGLTQRQIDRFMRHMSWAYWNELAEGVEMVMNFHIAGDAGGSWHLVAAPDGGDVGPGAIDGGEAELFFASPQVFFELFTLHVSFPDALTSGDLRVDGDAMRAMGTLRMFSASPPSGM